jgi:hypothetical protein
MDDYTLYPMIRPGSSGNFANNVARIFTTVGTGRQIQLDARFTF